MHVPTAYFEEFCDAFQVLLENHADQLVDVAVLTNVNGEPISELEQAYAKWVGTNWIQASGRTNDPWRCCRSTASRNC